MTYYSSYGCPFSCSFCSEPLTSNRRWFAKSAEKVIAELRMMKERYGVEVVLFEDPIFFVDVKRVRRIAELMIENDLGIRWGGASRLEAVKRFDAETWDLFKRSGLFQIFIGVESASPTVLKSIGKKYTADDIVEVSRILYENDVTLSCSFIAGIPVIDPERSLDDILREDLRLSSETIMRMAEVNPKAGIAMGLYTPYPGSVAYDASVRLGFVPPTELEGWREFRHRTNQVPWMLQEQKDVSAGLPIALKALRSKDRSRFARSKSKGALLYAYSVVTRARFRHGFFKYPVEQRLMAKLAKRMLANRDPEKQVNGYVV